MSITERELHLISSNPWNTRPIDEPHALSLAADIQANTLLQVPTGRQHPERPEYLQLASGHHRLHAYRRLAEAWQKEHPGQDGNPWGLFPVDVRELTDLQMAMIAIAENERRKDLSALEKARTLQRLIDEFKLSQSAAGAPFGLGQAAVSNLLRLLKLPEPIQVHVQSGALPERLARQLVSIAKIYPAEAQKIADAAVKVEPDQREEEFDDAQATFIRAKGTTMYSIDWKTNWPATPIKVVGHKSLAEIPACTGCEFYRKEKYGGEICLRKECFDQKSIEWGWTKVDAAAKKTGLPAGVKGKAYAYLIDSKTDDKYFKALLKSQHPSLVLVPTATEYSWHTRQLCKELLGSEHVTLASSDIQAVWLAVPKPKEKPAASARPAPAYDYKAEEAKRLAREKECSDLVHRAAPLIARALPWKDPVTVLLWDTIDEMWGDGTGWKKARTPIERSIIYVEALLAHKAEFGYAYGDNTSEKHVRQIVLDVAKVFGARLPDGWDQAPAPAVPPAPKLTKPVKSSPAANRLAPPQFKTRRKSAKKASK